MTASQHEREAVARIAGASALLASAMTSVSAAAFHAEHADYDVTGLVAEVTRISESIQRLTSIATDFVDESEPVREAA